MLFRSARDAVQIDREKLMEDARLRVLQGWLNKVWFVIDETNRATKPHKPTGKLAAVAAPGERLVNVEELRKHLRERRALPFTLITDLAFPVTGQEPGADDGTRSVARFIEQFPVEAEAAPEGAVPELQVAGA